MKLGCKCIERKRIYLLKCRYLCFRNSSKLMRILTQDTVTQFLRSIWLLHFTLNKAMYRFREKLHVHDVWCPSYGLIYIGFGQLPFGLLAIHLFALFAANCRIYAIHYRRIQLFRVKASRRKEDATTIKLQISQRFSNNQCQSCATVVALSIWPNRCVFFRCMHLNPSFIEWGNLASSGFRSE